MRRFQADAAQQAPAIVGEQGDSGLVEIEPGTLDTVTALGGDGFDHGDAVERFCASFDRFFTRSFGIHVGIPLIGCEPA